MKSDNNIAVLTHVICELEIPVTKQTIKNELNRHPEPNSLLAFSDLLANWNISNAAYQLEFKHLQEVPCPFIAHFLNKEFVVVSQFDSTGALISNERFKNRKISTDEFKRSFSGSVLVAEKGPASGEPDFSKKKWLQLIDRLQNRVSIALAILIILCYFAIHPIFFKAINLNAGLLILTKAFGLFTAILLLIQSIDIDTPLIPKLCGRSKNQNCNRILSSKASKVFDWLSWSEIGFFYFAGTWLLVVFSWQTISVIQVLVILNIFSLPYTFYSVYYQIRVAKQLCLLCCTIQGILWLEFVELITYPGVFSMPVNINWIWLAGKILISCGTPIVLWMFLKPLLLKSRELRPLNDMLNKFKYNANLFKSILKDQPLFAQPDDTWSIVLGNIEANTCITMVSNPYCQPCAKMHKLLDELLHENPNVQARIIFTSDNSDKDLKTPISRHLMALNELSDRRNIEKALTDWYEQNPKNYETWALIHPVKISQTVYHQIDQQNEWCKMAEITVTPTLLLNGRLLPDLYQLTDLKYMLE